MQKFPVLMVVLLLATATLVWAVPAGGNACKDCHNAEVFPKRKQGTVKITMEEIYAGRLCGVCHNGKRAFDAKSNCARCHVKQ
ncbi:MAG: cytochrome c3 family protein [Desulfuromonadales bacterium]